MNIKTFITVVISASLLITTTAANASVIIIANDSYIETYSEAADRDVSDSEGLSDAYTDTGIPSGFVGDISSTASVPGATADGDAFMDVIIESDAFSPMFITMDMAASASAETFTADGSAFSFAESVLEITFVTDEFYDFNFGAEFMTAFGSAAAEVSIINSVGTSIMDIYIEDDTASPYETVLAPADEYTLFVSMLADADLLSGPDFMTSDASGLMFFDITPVVVPIPTAAWLFGSGLIGLVAVARRKK